MCLLKKSRLFFLLFSIVLFILSCKQTTPEEQLNYINGYWEIEEVVMPGGDQKAYTLNTLVDYIEISDSTGFRKKVAPQIDGRFKVTDDTEKISVKIEGEKLQLYYSTPFYSWKETVKKADKDHLIIQNEDLKVYKYKRYAKLNLEE